MNKINIKDMWCLNIGRWSKTGYPVVCVYTYIYNGKAVPLQAWSSPEGSRKLTFPDFMTMVQDGGKVVSLTYRPLLPP
jgi:hypothetical protein